jgi:hypothetical protein
MGGRSTLANWLYHDLREYWGDEDRLGVHSFDEVLGSATLHSLWQEAACCSARV